jgi:membrane protein
VRTTSLPGFGGIPIYTIFQFIYKELVDDDIVMRANAMAYSFFISLFPSILVLISVGALLPFDLLLLLKSTLEGILPSEAETYLFNIIDDIEQLPHTGILSIGFILIMYFSSSGIIIMMRGFQKSYPTTFKERSWLRRQAIAVFIMIILFILLVSASILVIFGNILISWLTEYTILGGFETFMLQLLKWIIALSLFYSIIAFIYKLGPALHKKFKFFSPGATLATIISILLTLGFSLYVENFGTFNKLYGSIGAFIVILIWIQLNCFVLLLGFELNASIAVNKDLRYRNQMSHKNQDVDPQR